MSYADGMGLLCDVQQCDGHLAAFNITVQAVQLSREIQEAKRKTAEKDRVEHAQSWIRRSPWTAYPLIAILALIAFVAFLNQLLELLERLGILAAKK